MRSSNTRPPALGASEEEAAAATGRPELAPNLQDIFNLRLIENGDTEKLKELLRERLIESRWRDEMNALCRAYAKKKGRNNVTVQDVMHVDTPKGRGSVIDPSSQPHTITKPAAIHSEISEPPLASEEVALEPPWSETQGGISNICKRKRELVEHDQATTINMPCLTLPPSQSISPLHDLGVNAMEFKLVAESEHRPPLELDQKHSPAAADHMEGLCTTNKAASGPPVVSIEVPFASGHMTSAPSPANIKEPSSAVMQISAPMRIYTRTRSSAVKKASNKNGLPMDETAGEKRDTVVTSAEEGHRDSDTSIDYWEKLQSLQRDSQLKLSSLNYVLQNINSSVVEVEGHELKAIGKAQKLPELGLTTDNVLSSLPPIEVVIADPSATLPADPAALPPESIHSKPQERGDLAITTDAPEESEPTDLCDLVVSEGPSATLSTSEVSISEPTDAEIAGMSGDAPLEAEDASRNKELGSLNAKVTPLTIEWPASRQRRTRPPDSVSSGMIHQMFELVTQRSLPSLEEAVKEFEDLTTYYHGMGYPKEPWMDALRTVWLELISSHHKKQARHQWETEVLPKVEALQTEVEGLKEQAKIASSEAATTRAFKKEAKQFMDDRIARVMELCQECASLVGLIQADFNKLNSYDEALEELEWREMEFLQQADVLQVQIDELEKDRPTNESR